MHPIVQSSSSSDGFRFLFFYSARFQVTGVFCQSAIDSAQNDHATVVQSILANKEMHIQKIRKLFSRFDQQETGVITFAILEEKLDSSEVREYFETLGLDVWDAWTFFKLLDLDAGLLGRTEAERCWKYIGIYRVYIGLHRHVMLLCHI